MAGNGKDITNQRFGKLTALYPTEKRTKDGNVIWHCVCDCGNETDVSRRCLVRGNTHSCGCLAELEDLVGKTFGKLTVVKQLPLEPGKKMGRKWLCRCECGNTTELYTKTLKAGIIKSCGCSKKAENLIGRVFGKLTVLGLSDKRGPRGFRTVPLWECRCECGNITYKATDTLKNDEVSMCSECNGRYGASFAREQAGFVEGTQVSKLRSTKPSRVNKTGVRGVSYSEKTGLYSAHITFKGKKMKLGTFSNFRDAIKARFRAEEEYFETFLEEYERDQQGKIV